MEGTERRTSATAGDKGAAAYERQKRRAAERSRRTSLAGREIAPLPPIFNARRRAACKKYTYYDKANHQSGVVAALFTCGGLLLIGDVNRAGFGYVAVLILHSCNDIFLGIERFVGNKRELACICDFGRAVLVDNAHYQARHIKDFAYLVFASMRTRFIYTQIRNIYGDIKMLFHFTNGKLYVGELLHLFCTKEGNLVSINRNVVVRHTSRLHLACKGNYLLFSRRIRRALLFPSAYFVG